MEEQKKESNRKWLELKKESDERWEALQEETRKLRKETRKLHKESNRLSKGLKESLDRLNKHDKNLGDLAEISIKQTVLSLMKKVGIELNEIDTNVHPHPKTKHHKKYEYDIIAWNDKTKTVLAVEMKYKFRKRQVENFINGSLAEFKEIFPQFKDHTLYGAIASLTMEDNSFRLAQNSGLFVILGTPIKVAKMYFEEDFVPHEFP